MNITHKFQMIGAMLMLGSLLAMTAGCSQDQTAAPSVQASAPPGAPPPDPRPSVGMPTVGTPVDPRSGGGNQAGVPPGSPGAPPVGPGVPGAPGMPPRSGT